VRVAGEGDADVKDAFMQVGVHSTDIQAFRQEHILCKYPIGQGKVASPVVGERSWRTALAAQSQDLSVDPELQVFTFDRGHYEPKVQRIPRLAEANGNGERPFGSAPLLGKTWRRGHYGRHVRRALPAPEEDHFQYSFVQRAACCADRLCK
jgi:hypothetical protein